MKKLLGAIALTTGGIYLLMGITLSADNWTAWDKALAVAFALSLMGLAGIGMKND
jgi:hypothetical protein